jgi:hypothetical protein
LQTRDTLVNGPLDSSLAVSQGRSAALLILALGVLAGLVWTVGSALLDDRLPASVVLDRAAAAVVVLAAVIGIAAAHPVQRFRDFKQPPRQLTSKTHDLVKAHLLSTNGSGRYQLWRVAGREFKAEPLHGGGAGSFEAYWAQHATINGFVRDAHSLYIELLGELGIWGLLLVVGAFGTAIVTGLRRLLASADDERITIAAVLAAFGAYALGAGVDWMWELTAVSVVGIGLLGLLVGPATVPAPERRIAARYASALARPGRGVAARTAVGVIALFLVLAEGVPLLGQLRIRDSQAEIARGDLAAALSDAQSAKTIEPWAASPYVQVALVEEQAGQLRPARHRIRQAIHRDSTDWRLWVIQARLDTKLGDIPAAQKSIERARELNPRSPLLAKSA